MTTQGSARRRDWRPFGPRDPHEAHRVSTPLELLFDLVIVVAIASAAGGLHHGIVEGHAGLAVPMFVFAFFATWWAWMNYTWFASAYDNDGPVYRLITCWIMGGALVVAAGVPRFFTGLDLTLAILGYIVMRLGMVAFWLISARSDPPHRATALTYAIGIALVQVYWTLALLVFRPAGLAPAIALFVVGVLLELMVPMLAERRGMTPWHHHHIAERHGLFVIIVLGEVLLSSAGAFTRAADGGADSVSLVLLAVSALAITFAMWWLYFSQEGPLDREDRGSAFRWGYAHALIYAAGAATGAGFGVAIDTLGGGHGVPPGVNFAVAAPLALYMSALWLARDRVVLVGRGRHVLLAFALAEIAVATAGRGALPATTALPAMALLAAVSVWVRGGVVCRQA